jgi:hypothetical protein
MTDVRVRFNPFTGNFDLINIGVEAHHASHEEGGTDVIRVTGSMIPSGAIQGTHIAASAITSTKIAASAVTNVKVARGIMCSKVAISAVGGTPYEDVDDYLATVQSAGLLDGGDITSVGASQINVAACEGLVKLTASTLGRSVFCRFPAVTNLPITMSQIIYVVADYNAGTPRITTTYTYAAISFTDQFTIGRVFRNAAAELHIHQIGMYLYNFMRRAHLRVRELRNVERASGAEMSEPAARNLKVTAGEFWSALVKFTTPTIDTSAGGTFDYYYRSAVPGEWVRVTGQTLVDNQHWDDGSGVLANLTASRRAVFWPYLTWDGTLALIYGQANYTNAQAQIAEPPGSLPPFITEFGILIGRIIIQRNNANIQEISSAWANVFVPGAPTDHNDLAGLQGGIAGEYYHFDAADHDALISGSTITQHYHMVGTTHIMASAVSATKIAASGIDHQALIRESGQPKGLKWSTVYIPFYTSSGVVHDIPVKLV